MEQEQLMLMFVNLLPLLVSLVSCLWTLQTLPVKVTFLHVLVPHMATAQQSLHALFPV